MVVCTVVSCERDDRVGQRIFHLREFALGAGGEGGAPHPLTLTEASASVKNSRGGCCAIANAHSMANSGANQPTPCSGAQGCQSGSGKCARQYHSPQCSQYC